jgi:hypothetical protein
LALRPPLVVPLHSKHEDVRLEIFIDVRMNGASCVVPLHSKHEDVRLEIFIDVRMNGASCV